MRKKSTQPNIFSVVLEMSRCEPCPPGSSVPLSGTEVILTQRDLTNSLNQDFPVLNVYPPSGTNPLNTNAIRGWPLTTSTAIQNEVFAEFPVPIDTGGSHAFVDVHFFILAHEVKTLGDIQFRGRAAVRLPGEDSDVTHPPEFVGLSDVVAVTEAKLAPTNQAVRHYRATLDLRTITAKAFTPRSWVWLGLVRVLPPSELEYIPDVYISGVAVRIVP